MIIKPQITCSLQLSAGRKNENHEETQILKRIRKILI